MFSASKKHILNPGISNRLQSEHGQATLEAAFVIPIVMVLMLLLLQPGIILYDRIVMNSAAAEGCRLLSTSSGNEKVSEDFLRRRLSAIPQTDIFHIHSHGCSYNFSLVGNETSDEVSVEITNELKPLPLIDVVMGVAGLVNGEGNIEIKVQASAATQPFWAIQSAHGKSPANWGIG